MPLHDVLRTFSAKENLYYPDVIAPYIRTQPYHKDDKCICPYCKDVLSNMALLCKYPYLAVRMLRAYVLTVRKC